MSQVYEIKDAVAIRDTLKTTRGTDGKAFFGRPISRPSGITYFFQSANDYAYVEGNQYVWYGTFTGGSTPTNNTFNSWRYFLANLPAAASSLRILGTNDTNGKTLTTNVSTFVQRMKAGTSYNTINGLDTWYVLTGCTVGSPVPSNSPLYGTTSGEPVFISINLNGCTCGSGYMIRPHIQNANWGGINSAVCSGPTQYMSCIITV